MTPKEMKEQIDYMRDSVIIMTNSNIFLAIWIGLLSLATLLWQPLVYFMIAGAILILYYSFKIRKGIKQKLEEESKQYEQEEKENE